MDEWLARFLMVVEAVGLVCATGITAYWMKLRHQRKMLAHQADVLAVKEDLEELRTATHARLAELEDRLDFSERLLAQRSSDPANDEHPTPV